MSIKFPTSTDEFAEKDRSMSFKGPSSLFRKLEALMKDMNMSRSQVVRFCIESIYNEAVRQGRVKDSGK